MRRMLLLAIIGLLLLGGAVRAQDGSTALLELVETLPSDGSLDVTPDGALVAVFNRPVVAMTAIEALGDLPDPLRIEPAASGQGEWLNTAIYIFRPDPILAGGTTYTVSIDPALQAQDGASLAESPSWSFSTTEPTVAEIFPEPNQSGVRLDAGIQIRFNMPMDRASVEASFFLRVTQSGGSLPGSFEWADDGAGFRFTPNDLLSLDTLYEYGLNTNARGAGGGQGIEPATWSFATVPAPAVIRTSPFDGENDSDRYGITFYFASPMSAETLEGKVTFEPEPLREPDAYYSDWDNSYTLSFDAEPSTSYTVTLAAGAEDIFGNRIETPLTIRYATSAFDPNVSLQVPYGVGFYNANNDATQLYLTHLNVSQVDLELYGVPVDQFLPLLVGENSYDPAQVYTPPPDSLLRQWQVPSVAPLNARRYELLDLGSPGTAVVECPGSPASRLRVGDSTRVISEPDPMRARATPGDGEIVTLLYRDYAMPIIGGPECVDDILWWQVRLRDGEEAWVAEGVGEEYFLEGTFPTPVAIDVIDEGGPLAPGIYYLRAQSPETQQLGYGTVNHFMIVGTANLILKFGNDETLVWATDVTTGTPIANVNIRVYGKDYALLGQGTTNADGLMRMVNEPTQDLFQPRMAVLDEGEHFGIGHSEWSAGIEGYEFGLPVNFYSEPFRAYVYTDRPIYRPGQPVYFRGVVRARDDVSYTVPDLQTVPVRIYANDGSLVYEETLPLTPYGTFSGQFDIDADAALGYYRLETELPRPDPSEPYYGSEGMVSFNVAQYRAPEFQVNVTPEVEAVVQGDTIRVLVDSRYFFGGFVSNATVEYSVIAQPYFFRLESGAYYSFVDFDFDAGASELYGGFGGEIASRTGTTDAEGKLWIEVPADLRDATQSQTFTLEAVVSDESGQAVAGRTQIIVHKGQLYVGLLPQEYVTSAGDETAIDLIAVDWDGIPIANQTIEIDVVERRWSSVVEEDSFGRTTWSYEVEDIPLTTGESTTNDEGEAVFTFTPPQGGIYKVTARTRDAEGNLVVASTQVYVSSGEYVVWRQQNSNRIDLVADRNEYEVGDTAEILIASPFQGSAEALITVERGSVLQTERVTLTSNSYIYRLPIAAEFSPNIFVSVFIVKGVDDNNPVAAFRMGMVQLGVDTAQRALTLEMTPNVEQAGPGDEVTYTVRVTDYAGEPVQAEIGVGLTDLASLSIADPNTMPILNYYYGQQGLGVRTSSVLTINADRLTQEVLDTIKGGGGGFGDEGIFDIRQEFVDTAYWNAALVTDANGEAQFSVTLPDNLTTWRLDARALTLGADGNMLVGQDTFDLISTKPLLIRPITPRFFVVGDAAVVAAVVNNNTGQALDVDVRLEVGAPSMATLRSPDIQTVTIPAGGRQRVEWTLDIQAADAISLIFYALGDNIDFNDASFPPLGQGPDHLLPIYSYSAPETVATGGVVEAGQSVEEMINLPPELNVEAAALTLNVQPSLAAAALTGLRALNLPPHPTAEEVVSSFLPNLMTNRALRAIGAPDAALEAVLRERVAQALQYLYGAQKADGGWGWTVRERSEVVVTTYALIGLSEAQAQGFPVDAATIANAQRFLRTRLIVPGLNREPWEMNQQALILYALARSGAADAGRTSTLYEMRSSLAIYARALLAHTLALIDAGDARVQTLLDDLGTTALVSATGVHWEEAQGDRINWNTNTRTTALALNAFATLRPQSDLIPGIVRWLITARRADGWETRQETSWALMALGSAATALGESAGATAEVCAQVNGADVLACTLVDASRSVEVDDIPRDAATTVNLRSEAGRAYYTAQLNLLLPTPEVQPLNRGIVIERRYTMGEGEDMRSVSEACVGDTVSVRLTIIAPNALHYVVVEDPIPAGTDAVNPDLAISEQIGTRPELRLQDPLSQGWGWWWFSNIEFRDEKVVLRASYLPAGTYEFVYTIRAGLPGVYTVIPSSAREAYFPEVFGRSAGASFRIGNPGQCPPE